MRRQRGGASGSRPPPCQVSHLVASGGDEDVSVLDTVLEGQDMIALHARLVGWLWWLWWLDRAGQDGQAPLLSCLVDGETEWVWR